MRTRYRIEISQRRRSRVKPLRRGVAAVGWIVVGLVGLFFVDDHWPDLGLACRVFGHHPNRWVWETEEREETTCRHCGAVLVRERDAQSETAAAA